MGLSVDAASFQLKDWIQFFAPFIAAGGALLVVAFQRKERIGCVVTWGWGRGLHGGPEEIAYLVVHNTTVHSIAVSNVRYLVGFPCRPVKRATALNYEDPIDISFPYLVKPGEVRRFWLDESQAERLATNVDRFERLWLSLFRRHRIVLEVTTTMGTRRRIPAEDVLSWKERAPWLKA